VELLGRTLAKQLSRALYLAAVIAVVTGCEQQAGPPDKTISGKDYNEIVNSTVPENERGMSNDVRDSQLAPKAKR